MIQITCTMAGIGDNIMALTSVCGLKNKFPDQDIIFCCHGNGKPWVEQFNGYDRLVTSPLEGVKTFHVYDCYKMELSEQGRQSRAEYYAMFAGGVTPVLPTHKLLDPNPYPGCVVLVPFTHWDSRTWLVHNWLDLERMLLERGEKIVVLDNRKDRCAKFRGEKVMGQSPGKVMAILGGAKTVIAADTGMAHVAGALGTKTVVLCGPVRGESVFGIYPTVKSINGSLACSGCYWRGENYVPTICDRVCASLQGITPAQVLTVGIFPNWGGSQEG